MNSPYYWLFQLSPYLLFWWQTLQYMLGFAVVFFVLARLWPCNENHRVPLRQFLTDAAYWMFSPLLTRYVRLALIVLLVVHLLGEQSMAANEFIQQGFGPVALLPLWAQAAVVMVVQDIYMYWMHRLLHGQHLWRFHVIHHSSKQVDWHSTSRFHPVNFWLSFTMADILVLGMGFSAKAITIMAVANMFFSAMVHANLRWDFGPFRYVLASPVFHRWHHTAPQYGGMKNFAPTFPVLDLMFGTFYMPKGKLPEDYGVEDPVPETFLGQLFYPFLPRKKSLTNGSGDKSLPPVVH